MNKKEANSAISKIIAEVEELISKAEQIAVENDVSFYWDGPTYGMGGSFDPEYVGKDDEWGEQQNGWHASSQS